MPEMAFMLLLIMAMIAFSNWRYGFALCVLMALFQDPMRKLTPHQPIYFVVFVGAVFGAAWLGALMSRVPMLPNRIAGWRKHVGLPFNLFVILAVIQAAHSLFSYRNLMLTSIGMLSYFSPMPAIVLAYQFAVRRGKKGVTRWMKFYVVAASLALISVYLEYSGYRWRTLGEVGMGVLISGAGAYYKGNSGFFRGAEIAGWHAATAASFSFMLLWGRRFSLPKVLMAIGLVVFFIGLGVLTGRRKMIIEVIIFISAYVSLVVWFRHRAGKMAILLAAFGFLAYLGTVGMVAPGPGEHDPGTKQVSRAPDSSFGKYSRRAQTVFEDIHNRLDEIGLQPVGWAVAQFGWMGAGLGVGSQGTANFGVNTSGAAEGGLGKLTVELGLPGVALVGWLLVAFVLYVWSLLGPLASTSPKLANMAFGLVAFLLANMAAFSIATQAYADIFILLSLGWAVGFLLALPVLAKNEKEQMQRALQEAEFDADSPTGVLGGGPSAAYRQKFIRDRILPRR
jgi:hypothetical protein